LLGLPAKFQTWTLAAWLWPGPESQLSQNSFRGAPSSTTPCPSPPPDTAGLPDLKVWVSVQVLGAGGALGGPARPGVNFGGNTPNLGVDAPVCDAELCMQQQMARVLCITAQAAHHQQRVPWACELTLATRTGA
jgi:hypothetical protein